MLLASEFQKLLIGSSNKFKREFVLGIIFLRCFPHEVQQFLFGFFSILEPFFSMNSFLE
jgi:hypothetical protein